MVVAQLVEWLLPIPEVCGSNPVIGKNLYWMFTVNCTEKTKIRKKCRKWPIFSKKYYLRQKGLEFSRAKDIWLSLFQRDIPIGIRIKIWIWTTFEEWIAQCQRFQSNENSSSLIQSYLPTVWPDIGLKCTPNVSKSCPNRSQIDTFQNRRKSHECFWATFVSKFVAKHFKKSPNLVTLFAHICVLWCVDSLTFLLLRYLRLKKHSVVF